MGLQDLGPDVVARRPFDLAVDRQRQPLHRRGSWRRLQRPLDHHRRVGALFVEQDLGAAPRRKVTIGGAITRQGARSVAVQTGGDDARVPGRRPADEDDD